MKIGVDTLPPEGETFSFSLAGDRVLELWGPARADDGLRLKRVDAVVRLTPFVGGVDLDGRIHVEATVPCGRCLAEIALALDDGGRLRFERRRRGEAPEVELNDAAFDVVEFDGETVDLAAWAAEQAALALPEHPRCDEQAGRVCQAAGGSVAGPALDPRWSALAALKESPGD